MNSPLIGALILVGVMSDTVLAQQAGSTWTQTRLDCSNHECAATQTTIVGTERQGSGWRFVRANHQSGTHPIRNPSRITWEEQAAVYALCSTRAAVIVLRFGTSGPWHVINVSPGVESSRSTVSWTMMYLFLCHGIRNADAGDRALAARLGYPARLADRPEAPAVADPTSILPR